MAIGPEQEQEFNKIVEVAVKEASSFLTSNLGQSSEVEFSRLIDSVMTSDKVAIKADSGLVSLASNHGPISLIIANIHAINIAKLIQGDETEKEELTEEDLAIVSDLFNGAIDTILSSFKAQHEALELALEGASPKILKLEDDASLELPAGVDDSVGMGLKIKLESGLEMGIQIELNSALIEYLVGELGGVELTSQAAAAPSSDGSDEEEIQDTLANEEGGANINDGSTDFNPRRNLGFMRGVNMELVLELGRSEMPMSDILTLTRGSAIELDRPCDKPVDLYVHNQLVARGEVVAIDDNFGLKITELTGNLDLVSAASSLRPEQ
ncbi:MAG: FliM/FliN family flagellar motor switch protein [Candidatus Melainabacteria bacterium]|nr:FliM/FliN family flagellar motor switch protein [Candidatus Melainabacteria bacterium]